MITSESKSVPFALNTMQFTATTALPHEHLDRATAGLRAELRRQLMAADVHRMPDWDTFVVTGGTSGSPAGA